MLRRGGAGARAWREVGAAGIGWCAFGRERALRVPLGPDASSALAARGLHLATVANLVYLWLEEGALRVLVDAGGCGRAKATGSSGGAGPSVGRDQHVVHQLLFAVRSRGGLRARGRSVLLPVLVEVKRLADRGCVMVIGCLRVHAVLRPSRTNPEMVGRKHEAIVAGGCRTRGSGLNLQIQMMALRVVASRLLLGV